MRYLYELVWHYLSSNSRHGTHSPFVYKLADEVIYRSLPKRCYLDSASDKTLCLTRAISSYLRKELELASSDAILQMDVMERPLDDIMELMKEVPVLIVNNIYRNTTAKKKWSALKADQKTGVTIDLFYFGLIIFRKEQPKENFKLRFPY